MFTIKSINSRNYFFVLIAVLMLGTSVGFSQNCSANLSVEKERSTKSADEDGATFSMILKNTSSASQTYVITSVNLKEPCNSKSKNSNSSNVNLTVTVKKGRSSISKNEITIASGQTYSFEVFVSVPNGTPFNRWSCIEIQAASVKCNSIADTTILKVYVPDPSEG